MTVGSWQPGSQETSISAAALQHAITIDLTHFPDDVPNPVKPLQPFMQSAASTWQTALEALDTEALKQLCRFFTLAEKHWVDWFGGDKNPVIWICKILKARGAFPDQELTRWIKEHTDNRFLPYGNALG